MASGAVPVALGARGLAERRLEIRRFPECERELQRDRHRAAVRILRRHAGLEASGPVDEVPPRQPADERVGPLALREPVEHRARPGELPPDEGRVVAPHPVVVDHADPQQREGRDELLRRARVAAVGEPVGAARAVEGLDRLAREPVVAGDGVRDERLDAGVARVLQLLVVGTIHVGLVRARAGGAPAHVPQPLERRVSGVEASALLERVAGEVDRQPVERERLRRRLDVDLHVAPGAPPERVEDAPRRRRRAAPRPRSRRSACPRRRRGAPCARACPARAAPPGIRSAGGPRAHPRSEAPGTRSRASCGRSAAKPWCLRGTRAVPFSGKPSTTAPSAFTTDPALSVRYSIGGNSSGTSWRPSGVSW